MALTDDEQDRLYEQLKGELRFDPIWLAWEGGGVARIANDIAEAKRYDELPVLADALEDAGADARAVGFFRTRNRWALRALVEALPAAA